MFQLKCKKCPYNKTIDAIEVGLVDAEHVNAGHKLEIADLLYFKGQKVVLKNIETKDGNTITVLCLE